MKYREYIQLILDDLNRFDKTIYDHNCFVKYLVFLKICFRFDTFSVLFWFRTMQYLSSKKSILYKWLNFIAGIRLFYKRRQTGIQIPLSCKLGGGTLFCHFSCIVFAYDVSIGKNCSIHQGVTIGRVFAGRKAGVPTIGDNVIIFPGAKVIGKINVGNNVVIGANSTVIDDVPDNCVVVGSPARIVSNNSKNAISDEWLSFFAWGQTRK